MKYQAVLFDLDGTLLDTLEDLSNSANQALYQLGYPLHPINAYKFFVGDGVTQLARRVLPQKAQNEESISKWIADFRQLYQDGYAEKTKPYAGILELLDALQGKGLSLAILSNKPHEATEKIVAQLLPHDCFRVVQGALPDVPLKPDPTMALDICKRLAMEPGKCLYLGDTGTDMETAARAGMVPIGVLWGFRTAEELLAHGATALISHPEEILKYI